MLCRDSRLYVIDINGVNLGSCRLDFADDAENEIYESDSSSADKFEIRPFADGTQAYAVWNDSQAWLLDEERITVRYRIEDFAAAPASRDIVFISDSGRNKTGYFPIYSTQQLLDAAREYLTALGEA